jgi:hypothetical protein
LGIHGGGPVAEELAFELEVEGPAEGLGGEGLFEFLSMHLSLLCNKCQPKSGDPSLNNFKHLPPSNSLLPGAPDKKGGLAAGDAVVEF